MLHCFSLLYCALQLLVDIIKRSFSRKDDADVESCGLAEGRGQHIRRPLLSHEQQVAHQRRAAQLWEIRPQVIKVVQQVWWPYYTTDPQALSAKKWA